jgi:hypothetical protein
VKRVRVCLCLVFVALAPSVWSQVAVSGGAQPKEYSSPMRLEVPVDTYFVHGYSVWTINTLDEYVCEAVSIEKITVFKRSVTIKDAACFDLDFEVETYTRPGKDRWVSLTLLFENDREMLRVPALRKWKRINAEESKRRKGRFLSRVRREDFLRVVGGPNPRLVIVMTVEFN